MNKSRYKEITMNPLLCLSVGCRTMVCLWMQPMATTGNNSNSEYTIISVYERWGNASVHHCFFTTKKRRNAHCSLLTKTTNGGVYYVKETENADLKSGYADIVNN